MAFRYTDVTRRTVVDGRTCFSRLGKTLAPFPRGGQGVRGRTSRSMLLMTGRSLLLMTGMRLLRMTGTERDEVRVLGTASVSGIFRVFRRAFIPGRIDTTT